MARLHLHYERAFESYLRARRIPYVAVQEARRALLPADASSSAPSSGGDLKSFDFVLYGRPRNILADVKGRRVAPRRSVPTTALLPARPRRDRLESWVTLEDTRSLARWEALFGEGFAGAFVFVYWCDAQPPDGLFQEVFAFESRWYALRTVLLADYRRAMKPRSPRWGTVDVPAALWERVSEPFSADWVDADPVTPIAAVHALT